MICICLFVEIIIRYLIDFNFFIRLSTSNLKIYQNIGTDGYQADSIEVYTDPNTNYRCLFHDFLDGDTSEVGQCSPS